MQDRYEVGVVGKAPSNFSLLAHCTFLEGSESETDPCYEQWGLSAPGRWAERHIHNERDCVWVDHHSLRGRAGRRDPDLFVGGAPGVLRRLLSGLFSPRDERSQHMDLAYTQGALAELNLTSANPRDTPRITFHSFGEGVDEAGGDLDVQAVLEGMQYGMRAFDALIPLDGGFERVWPPLNITTEQELKQFIRDEAWGHHASCTAPIGADDDPFAVLDGEFRVRGANGLRVVDASVFPKIQGTYIALPIYMISEKAADVIIAAAEHSR